jgi:hypothetical protein
MVSGMPPENASLDATKEHRRGVQQACADLEQALARPQAPGPSDWSQAVVAALDELAEAFNRHVAHSEGPEGFLPDITSAAPRLAHAAEEIRREHADILAQISVVRDMAAAGRDEGAVQGVRGRSLLLLREISAHRYRGADLVYDAYTVDIEAAD